MIKKTVTLLILLVTTIFTSGYVKPDVYKIDAEKNAIIHNNLGLRDVSDAYYIRAIQEFTLAIALNPKTQATAVYYNNLGETYMKIGYYKQAQRCFENSITQYNLNFAYYQNLVRSFQAQKIVPSQIKYFAPRAEKNSLDMVTLGLLYVASGDVRRGIIKLDEFCMKEPDLLITEAVRYYMSEIIPKN